MCNRVRVLAIVVIVWFGGLDDPVDRKHGPEVNEAGPTVWVLPIPDHVLDHVALSMIPLTQRICVRVQSQMRWLYSTDCLAGKYPNLRGKDLDRDEKGELSEGSALRVLIQSIIPSFFPILTINNLLPFP